MILGNIIYNEIAYLLYNHKRTMQEKLYFKQSVKNWLHWYTAMWDKHLTLRLAGKPSFILERLTNEYGKDEAQKRYADLLLLLKEIGDDWFSPFVIYINNRK